MHINIYSHTHIEMQIAWTRAARTDKGVHALGNVISLKMRVCVYIYIYIYIYIYSVYIYIHTHTHTHIHSHTLTTNCILYGHT
jgi:tRNA pseudouridine(38-40) synthase